MNRNLNVSSWVVIRQGCPISYRVNGHDDIEFRFGSLWDGFEFVFDAAALHEFVGAATLALGEMADRAS